MSKEKLKKIPLPLLKDVRRKLEEVANILHPYLVVLSQTERNALVKVAAQSFKFTELSYTLAVENPELFPGFMKAAILGEEFLIARELCGLAAMLEQLKKNVSDTKMAACNHTLEAALSFYQTVKIAARRDIPGTGVIYEELKSRRPSRTGRRRRQKTVKNAGQPELFGIQELSG